jgi:O-antigen ligase
LIELVLNPALLIQLGLETRYEYSLSNATALLAFTILFYARICKFKLFENFQEWLMMGISLFSVAISFSRTDYFLLLVMILIPLITKSIYILKIYWLTVFVVVLIIFGGFFIKVESSAIEEDTFQSKINHSFNEILVQDYETSFEISQNWRGYEAFLGLTKFSEGNFIEILVGQGFGTVVYTPNWIFNGEMDSLDVLPMFHNGFITVLLKTGLIGLFFFFLFLFKLLKVSLKVSVLSFSKLEKLTTMLLQAAVFTVLLLTFVVHGIFTTTTPVLLLIIVGATLKMKTLRGKIIKLN